MRMSRLVRGLLAVALLVVSMSGQSPAKPTLLRSLDFQPVAKDVASVAFSPDGKIVATVGFDGQIRLWPVADDRSPRVVGHDVKQATFSPDGHMLAGLVDGKISLWDVGTLEDAGRILAPERLERFVWANGILAGVSLANGYVIDTEARQLVRTLSGANQFITMDAAAKLVGSFSDTLATVWSVSSGRLKCTVTAGELKHEHNKDPAVCTAITISPDKRFIATADADGTVILASLPGGEPIKKLRVTKERGTVDVVFSPDSRRFATVPTIGGVQVWDTDFKLVATVQDSGNCGAFSPDGQILAVGRDQGVRLWKLDPP